MQIGLHIGVTARRAASGSAAPSHVFIVVGQSNASGRALEDSVDAYPPGVLEWGSAGTWSAIGSRLYHGAQEADVALALPDPNANFAWDRPFAAAYAVANPGVQIRLIGAADGGKGFFTNDWNKGNPSYNFAVSAVGAAMAAAPGGSVIKGILWHQGENDGQSAPARAAYQANLLQFISDFKADIGVPATTPFVAGGHILGGLFYNSTIQAITQALPNLRSFTGYADISSPTEAVPKVGDTAHMDAPSARNLGPEYLRALTYAAGNSALSAGGTITTGTLTRYSLASGASVSLAGVALGTAAADRLVIVAVEGRATAPIYVKTASLGGVNLVRVGTPNTGASVCGLTLFYANIPAGTTGTFACDFSSAPAAATAGIMVLPVYGARPHLASATGFANISGGTAFGTAITTAVDRAVGDLVFAVSGTISPALAVGSLSLGNSVTGTAGGGNVGIHAGWQVQAAAGALSITASFGATTVNFPALSALVLRPA